MWASFGFATVVAIVDDVNADTVVIVIAVAVMSSTAALAAVALLGRRRDRAAGASLLVSSAMPTCLWYPFNNGRWTSGAEVRDADEHRGTTLRRAATGVAPGPAHRPVGLLSRRFDGRVPFWCVDLVNESAFEVESEAEVADRQLRGSL